MLVSIILERRSVTIYGSARLSSLRSGNDGPTSLITALYGNYRNASLWSIVAILLFCTTLALQFASTILVWDIGIGKVAEPDRENATLVALSYDNLNISAMDPTRQAPYWLEATKIFPTFAENSSPAIRKYLGNEPMRDTGVSHRAFVPFLNSTIRTSMKRFAGIATVVDSRVACVRPKIHDGFSVALTQERRWLLNGTLTPEVLPEGLILGDSPAMTGDLDTVSFNATIDGTRNITLDWAQEIPFAHDAGEWNIIQKLVYLGPGLVSSLDPRYPKIIQDKALIFNMSNADDTRGWGLSYLLDGDNIPLMTGRSYLLLNTTVLEHPSPLPDKLGPFDPKNLYFSSSQERNQLVLTPQDDWLIFTLPRVPGWHLSNYTDREVMRLETTPENLREQVKVCQNFIRDSLKEKNKLGALMCAGCGLQFKGDGSPRIAYQVNNMVQQQIFQDVMITTNNTAKAWQAFFTLVGGMAYYDKLPFFDVNDSAMISWFQSAQFPRTRRGFWALTFGELRSPAGKFACRHISQLLRMSQVYEEAPQDEL
ncbi:hypothetical protein IL306_012486 [Fusarium sp. DS 682]|nr:hypothetical protein IL306_012486 [Fusarium sp. DS 682]